MRKTTGALSATALTAGLLAAGSPALADSTDNDGVNIGNDNNVSVLPIQACGNNVAVAGVVAPILSPNETECVNAPIVDHPENEKPEKPEKPDPEKPEKPDPEKPEKPDPEKPEHPGGEGGANLPTAPSPEVVPGHHAVTG